MENEDETIVVLYGKYMSKLWKKTTVVEHLFRAAGIDYVIDTLFRVSYENHIIVRARQNWDGNE